MAGAIIVLAAAIFAAGVSVGVIVIVSIGIRREERDFSLTGRVSLTRPAPGRISHGSRSILGVHVRQEDGAQARPSLPPRQDLLV